MLEDGYTALSSPRAGDDCDSSADKCVVLLGVSLKNSFTIHH
jgi:hypothetical protein